ncbi:MAG TPA: adenosylmethionine--8-amino-7-oxononanoate transaminase [Xanthobacteraceae bacterium]
MTSASPVWHPFTQHAVQPDAIAIARGEGAWLETVDDRRIFDAISSWWVVTHGHRHPHIVQAIKDQADRLDQVIFAGFTHEPAEKLARQLVAITPPGLEYVFFSDSGSTSVEVALKMALGFWRNRGEQRSRILALEGAYHGDTIGGMSVGERGVFNVPYDPLLFDVERIPFPAAGREQATLDAIMTACRSAGIAALIVEPLILGAGGMLMYSPQTLKEMHRICAEANVLFIADEVMTGWGRTGTLFACEQAEVLPDIVCYSKGITGGALPLAVTLSTPAIFEAHYSTDRTKTFFHSSSYTANAIACAAALANLKLWDDPQTREQLASLCAMQERAIEPFRNDSRFENVRRCGSITAMDLKVGDAGYLAGIGPKLLAHFNRHDILLRPLGNTIYVMPPYCVTPEDIERIYGVIAEAAATRL